MPQGKGTYSKPGRPSEVRKAAARKLSKRKPATRGIRRKATPKK